MDRMAARPDSLSLARQYDCEWPHAEHVRRLAVELFKATGQDLGLKPYDLRLLETAAFLHDIGYAVTPSEHDRVGADLIRRNGLKNFTPAQTDYIAAIVLLHCSAAERPEAREALERIKNPRRALQLAALLRVADGLDHGHVQDAHIEHIRIKKKTIRISVRCEWYVGNIESARRKADLWQNVMPRGLEIKRIKEKRARGPFAGLIFSEDGVRNAARKALFSQYRILRDNIPGAMLGGNPEFLHDLRVGLRRYRSALRLFRPYLREGSNATDIEQESSDLLKALGPIRDAQVWIDFLESDALKSEYEKHPHWPEFMVIQRERDRQQLDVLRRILESDSTRRWLDRAAYFMRIEIPRLLREDESLNIRSAVAGRLRKQWDRVLDSKPLIEGAEPENMHTLRKRVRKCRYWAEFTAPAFGKNIRKLAAQLKSITSALGGVHDMDVHIEELTQQPEPLLDGILPVLTERRKQHLKTFENAWCELTASDNLRNIRRTLKRHES